MAHFCDFFFAFVTNCDNRIVLFFGVILGPVLVQVELVFSEAFLRTFTLAGTFRVSVGFAANSRMLSA